MGPFSNLPIGYSIDVVHRIRLTSYETYRSDTVLTLYTGYDLRVTTHTRASPVQHPSVTGPRIAHSLHLGVLNLKVLVPGEADHRQPPSPPVTPTPTAPRRQLPQGGARLWSRLQSLPGFMRNHGQCHQRSTLLRRRSAGRHRRPRRHVGLNRRREPRPNVCDEAQLQNTLR